MLRYFHLLFGLALFVAFLVTGQFMRHDFPDKSLIVLSCDMPLLSSASLEELILQYRSPEEIILYALDGVPQPFPGIYGYRLQETV